jgi:hypothetical protein
LLVLVAIPHTATCNELPDFLCALPCLDIWTFIDPEGDVR